MSKATIPVLALALAGLAASCAPKRIHEEPVLENGARTPPASQVAAQATGDLPQQQALTAAERDARTAQALSTCAGAVCTAIARGEVALEMTQQQFYAATRTTQDAWTVRDADGTQIIVPRSLSMAPRDVVGEIAMVQLRGGRIALYSYREAQGMRVVAQPADATTEARAAALADMLVREGDDLAARGALNDALNRYDRASVLKTSDPMIDYRIATVLDKSLRPIEALVRYQLFLHRLELEKIQAVGKANAELAQAIALAQQRIVVLEKQR